MKPSLLTAGLAAIGLLLAAAPGHAQRRRRSP